MAIGNHNDLTHIVRTSDQWKNTYDKYELIPTGVLCVELVSSDVTKIKIGDGHNIFSKLPYIGDLDLSKYYTKLETDTRIKEILTQEKVVRIKGLIGSKSDLPADARCGDIYFVRQLSSSDNKYIEYIYSPDNTWEPLGGIPVDIDLSEYAKTAYVDDKIEQVNERIDDIEQHGTHTHANKDILDLITAAFTAEEKDKLSTLYNYDDTELRELITQASHTHSNKDILDAISAPFTKEDKSKLDRLNPYDDSILKEKIQALERLAHEHSNKRILDRTTASFTTEYERKMRWIRLYTGCTGMEEGIAGLVPAAQAGEEDYVLSGSGEWVPQTGGGGTYELPIATASTLGGIKVGDGLDIDANGKLSVVGGGGGDSIAEGDGITITTDPQTGVKTISVDTGNGLQINQDGEVEIDPSIIPELTEYAAGEAINIRDVSSTLPAGYVEVDYIEGVGNYAVINYIPNRKTKIVGTASQTQTSYDPVLFGNRTGSAGQQFVFWFNRYDSTQAKVGFVYGTNTWSTSSDCDSGKLIPYTLGDQFTFLISLDDEFNINDSFVHNITENGAPASNLKLGIFALVNSSSDEIESSDQIFRGRIYEFKIYEDDELVVNLIPAVSTSNNQSGFYDVINDIFYTSKTATPFGYDPSTIHSTGKVIDVNYGNGLSVNQDNELEVNTGNGLQINQDGELEIDPSIIPDSYEAGNGIEITEVTHEDEFRVQNQEYFFTDHGLTCIITGNYGPRTFTKINDGDIVAAVIGKTGGWYMPLFVGLTEDSVKYSNSYDSNILGPTGSFTYHDKTWYYTADYALTAGDGIDHAGHLQSITDTIYDGGAEGDIQAAKDLIDLAVLLPDVSTPTISAKIGNGLSFDANGAIQADAQPLSPATDSTLGGVIIGDGILVDSDGTISVDPTIIPEVIEYEAGTAISIEEAEHGGVTFDAWDNGTGWENVCYLNSTGNSVVSYQYEAHSPISNSYTLPAGATHIRAIAYDQNDTMLWTSFSWIDSNNYHFASTSPEDGHYNDWFEIPTGAVKVNFGVRHSKLNNTTAMSLNDIKSVNITIQTVSELEVDVWNGGTGWLNGDYTSGNSDSFATNWYYTYHYNYQQYIEVPAGATHVMVRGISNENDSHFEGGGINAFDSNHHHVHWWGCAWEWHEISSDVKYVQPNVKWNNNNTRTISAADIKSVTLAWKLPALETNTAINVKYGNGLTVNQNNELELTPATQTTLGGIKIGSGFTYLIDGTLNANPAMQPFEVGTALELLYDDPDALPTGYAHVDYVSSNPATNSTSSTNYGRARTLIDYTPENVTKLEIKMARDNDYQDSCFVGCRVSGSENHFVLWHENRSSDTQVAFVYGSKTYNDAKATVSYVTGQVQEIEANIPPAGTSGNITVSVNGSVVKTYAKSGSPLAYKLGIFQSNRANEWEYRISNGRIYYLRLYEGNTLAVNLIPAVRLADEVVGFYDNVNDKFYTSSTDYPFTTDMSTIVIDGAHRTLNAKYNNGLILNQNNELEVNIGTGLEFDQVTGAINVVGGGGSSEEGNLIVEGDGIEINSLSFNIPKNYAGISYIEGNGQQWTQLDYTITHDTRVVIEMSSYETETTSRAIFGSRRSANPPQFITWLAAINGSDYIKTAFIYGSNEYDHYYDTTVRRGTRFTLDASVNGLYINNTLIQSITDQGTMPTDKLGLFAIANGDGTYETSKGMGKYRIFSVKIYDGNSLEMDLVPLLYLDYEHTAKIPGLYDLINEKFYPSLTATDFVYDSSSIVYPVYEVSAKLGNGLQFDQNDAIEVKVGDGLSIDPITGELFVDGQLPEGTIIKKLTYTGTGTNTNNIQFDKKPLVILSLNGSSGQNYGSLIPTFIDSPYLHGVYGGPSNSGTTFRSSMAYDDSTNVLSITNTSDEGLAFNIVNKPYVMYYLIKGHTGSGTSVNNEVSVIKTISYTGTGTSTNNIQLPETPDYILGINGRDGISGDMVVFPFDNLHPSNAHQYIYTYCYNSGISTNYFAGGHGEFAFNSSTNILTLTGGDQGAACNYLDRVYYLRYVVNETISSYEYTEGGGISITPDPQTGENIISVNVGSGLSIDPNTGELNVTGGGGGGDTVAEGNGISINTDQQTGEKVISVDIGSGLAFDPQTGAINVTTGSGDTVAQGNGINITTDQQTGDKVIAVNAGSGLSFDQTTHALEVSSGVVTSISPTQNTPGSITVTEGDGTTTPVSVISQMGGATSSTAGTAGYVPAPASGDDDAYLRGDGTWDDSVLTEDDELTLVFVPDDYQPS